MSKMRIVMFGLAIGSAVLAGVLAKGVIGKKPKVEKQIVVEVKKKQVLVAAADVQVGERLAQGTVVWKDWPEEAIQDFMITKDEMPEAEKELTEARAMVPIFAGETIIDKKYVMPGAGGFMSAILPKGMRAVSLAIQSRASAGGFILPNDRVDILLTKKLTGEGQLVKSETVISNVRVLAINQVLRKVQDGDDVAMKEVEMATFELEPMQAEILAKVETEGELSLVLRSIAENTGTPMDLRPELAEKYKNTTKAKVEGTVFVRAGIVTTATSP
jgi:pilus assembly protein CpaB